MTPYGVVSKPRLTVRPNSRFWYLLPERLTVAFPYFSCCARLAHVLLPASRFPLPPSRL